LKPTRDRAPRLIASPYTGRCPLDIYEECYRVKLAHQVKLTYRCYQRHTVNGEDGRRRSTRTRVFNRSAGRWRELEREYRKDRDLHGDRAYYSLYYDNMMVATDPAPHPSRCLDFVFLSFDLHGFFRAMFAKSSIRKKYGGVKRFRRYLSNGKSFGQHHRRYVLIEKDIPMTRTMLMVWRTLNQVEALSIRTKKLYEIYTNKCTKEGTKPVSNRQLNNVVLQLEAAGIIKVDRVSYGRYGTTNLITVIDGM